MRCCPDPAGRRALLQRGGLLLLVLLLLWHRLRSLGGRLLLRLRLLLHTRLLLRLLLLLHRRLLSLRKAVAWVGRLHPGCLAGVAPRVAGPVLAALAFLAEPVGPALGRRVDSATGHIPTLLGLSRLVGIAFASALAVPIPSAQRGHPSPAALALRGGLTLVRGLICSPHRGLARREGLLAAAAAHGEPAE
jgi:hypothetical protein